MKLISSFFLKSSLIVLSVFCIHSLTLAQERANTEVRVSPNASITQTIGTTMVSINYGRPAVRNREIFGQLVPFNKVWRTGANEATTITFSDDVMIEGEKLKAGTYSLFTIPGKDKWTLIFNNVPAQWGAFDYDSSKDALRVKVEPKKGIPIEQMMFYFKEITANSATAVFHWDETKVPFTVEV